MFTLPQFHEEAAWFEVYDSQRAYLSLMGFLSKLHADKRMDKSSCEREHEERQKMALERSSSVGKLSSSSSSS